MCGLAGIVSADRSRVAAAPLEAAIACLRHRGPESNRGWRSPKGHCALAHGRLSIIDPDPRSLQPFHYGDRYALVYNGELYNYVELRDELRALGHPFGTGSDTEVLAAAWAAWGPGCVQRFEGAFAFALWDEREQRLFAARDRFGEKPLFFSFDGSSLVLASELKALWALGVHKEVNAAMAYNFLTLGYSGNPRDGKETFYHNVWKLPAAHTLSFAPAGEGPLVERYWEADTAEIQVSDAEATDRFRSLFAASVTRRLRSDVAIGTSLSGGIDSAAVVAFCAQAGGSFTHKAFTAVFPGFEKDEEERAGLIAKHLGLQQELVYLDDAEVPALMDRVMRHQEEPISSGSALAQFKVYEAAKRSGVTVLLDGQGADELLAGYTKYYRWYWQELYRAKQLKESGELEAARRNGVTEPFDNLHRVAALFPDLASSLLEGRKGKLAARTPGLHPDWAAAHKQSSYYTVPAQFTLNGALYYNSFGGALEELLRIADRNSMAHSVEVRLPFLSHDLVEFLFSLPARFKIRNGWTKWLLREATSGVLPESIVWQKGKTGFEPPQAQWMATGAVQEAIRAGTEKLVAQGWLDAAVLREKIQPHSAYAAVSQHWRYWSLSYLL
ncbi:MAG: asparagine synthase (glutamine-hydrolyzing) [Chitinophagaceae bacterium]|nr:MAG: asparagine synthase (glutamine-hydrolyzing) [Chitinophagaceae bacterium]